MRSRFPLSVLVVAILVVATFAALNWTEFLRTSPLSFGPVIMDAPLGLIMLGLLILTLLAFMVSSSVLSTRHYYETRQHVKSLEAQRELADKAEASRFTELRTHLDTQLRELRQRDAIAATEFEKAMVQSQRELRTQLEQMNRAMTARLGEMESRFDQRFAHLPGFTPGTVRSEPLQPAVVHPAPAQPMPTAAAKPDVAPTFFERVRGGSETPKQDLVADTVDVREEQERAQAARQVDLERADFSRDDAGGAAPRTPEQTGWRRWF